jgi:COP9 signalosome complex subunit 5
MNNQKFQDPFVAVVVSGSLSSPAFIQIQILSFQVDPNRTISAGKVDIGAFRTYPEGYTPLTTSSSEYQSIPLNKIEDFGVHANQYYPIDVVVFKSKMDDELLGLLWNKYWVSTLSQSPLISVRSFFFSFDFKTKSSYRDAVEQSLCCLSAR